MDKTRKIIRYILILLSVYLGVSYMMSNKLDTVDILSIVFYVAVCFALLDMYYPIVVCE